MIICTEAGLWRNEYNGKNCTGAFKSRLFPFNECKPDDKEGIRVHGSCATTTSRVHKNHRSAMARELADTSTSADKMSQAQCTGAERKALNVCPSLRTLGDTPGTCSTTCAQALQQFTDGCGESNRAAKIADQMRKDFAKMFKIAPTQPPKLPRLPTLRPRPRPPSRRR